MWTVEVLPHRCLGGSQVVPLLSGSLMSDVQTLQGFPSDFSCQSVSSHLGALLRVWVGSKEIADPLSSWKIQVLCFSEDLGNSEV